MNELLTAKEARQRLRVSAPTLWRLRRQGLLRSFKLPGGGLRFREEDLAQVLKEESAAPK